MGRKSKAKKERGKQPQAANKTAAEPEVTVRMEGGGTTAPAAPSAAAKSVDVSVSVSGSGAKSPPEPAAAAGATQGRSQGGPPRAAGPSTMQAGPPSDGGRGKGVLYALLGVVGLGLCVAIYLLRHKLKITLDPTYVSSCNLGGAIDCDRVNVSAWSEVLGIPIALFAIPTYAVMAYFTWIALKARDAVGATAEARRIVALRSIATIGLLTVAYSIFLAFVSSVWVRAYCLYCISLYAVNVVATLLAFRAGAGSLVDSVGGSLRALAGFATPIPAAIAVFAVSGVVAYGGYDFAEHRMEAAYKRLIDEQMSDAATPPAATAPAAAEPAVAEPAASSPPAVPAAAPAAQGLESTERGTRGGKKTDDGYTYFAAPLEESTEFWAGNPTAQVTVVKYADFQCAYCRQLAQSLKQVEQKYHDRVRFVMKHFPMNIQCNRAMRGFDKHPVACGAAYAAHCAGVQGKFWEMHDLLYDNQPSLSLEKLTELAQQLDLDMPAFDACTGSPETEAAIKADVESGLYAGIYGTPRTYINNRLVTGSAHAAILEYYIDKAFEELAGKAPAQPQSVGGPKPDGRSMIEVEKASGVFYIDPYEAAITKDGRAVSQPGVEPAQADYYMAKEACEKSGKRLCSEEEWVSACTGSPAVDENANKMFADDHVEGNMYPYGAYHEEGVCHDRADERTGSAVRTGSFERCRTPSGIYDLAGNIGEWADSADDKPTSLGGSMSSATGAVCNRRTFSTSPGSRNRTTGFRCCADSKVQSTLVAEADIAPNIESLLNEPVPTFEVEDTEGNKIRSTDLKGGITLVNFFASWCGPCKKEFPYLVEYAGAFKGQGLRLIGVGVDTLPDRSIDFAAGFEVNFPIVTDAEARLKGKFLVYEMPATFLVDRQGTIRYTVTGFSGAEQEQEMRKAIEDLLKP